VLKVLMGAMGYVAHSKSRLLDPDRNPVVGRVIRALVYDHFCAGTSPPEVKRTITEIKKAGYAGVILGYGREIVVEPGDGDAGKVLSRADSKAAEDKHIAFWLDGNMTTLGMIGRDDYMNVK
jgi:proline dehydrogenase